jgi:DNA-binding response OmpR family regulator
VFGQEDCTSARPPFSDEEKSMLVVNELVPAYRPCVVLAHADAARAREVERSFRRLGWDVYQAASGPEARRLARMLAPELVILDAELPQESGWLTCAKLAREGPSALVILVAQVDAQSQEYAAFVGASAVVRRDAGVTELLAPAKLSVAG